MNVDSALDLLRHAMGEDRMAQSYILAGPPQTVGRELTTRILEMVYCVQSPSVCGQCPGCVKIANLGHEDVMWVEPQMRSRSISIAQIRDLQSRMTRTAMAGGWKTCILLSADRLGQEASNAFLKTLEEPPGRSLFLLLTENPQFLLSTIRSRCQTIRLDGESQLDPEIESELLGILTEPVVGDVFRAGHTSFAAFAQSERLQALLKRVKDAAEAAEAEAAHGDDTVDADVVKARASARYRETRAGVMRSLSMWYRDVMILTCGGQPSQLHFPDHIDLLKEAAERVAVPDAVRKIRVVEQMHQQMERNLPEAVVFESGLPYLQS